MHNAWRARRATAERAFNQTSTDQRSYKDAVTAVTPLDARRPPNSLATVSDAARR
jgi:hypothetical protein